MEVDVRDFRERPLPGAQVVLRPGTGKGQVRLAFDERTSTFRATDVKPGPYVLAVSHRGYEAQSREIEVQPAGNREIAILGTQGMPAFYRGKVRVPFEPRPDLIAATLRGRRDPQAQSAVEQTARRLGLEPQEVPEPVRQSNVVVFRLPGQTNEGRK
ncbi:MAG TPA: carboxypeptidase regulatory-like domain-containing protein, partial [Thermoanaerobaculia bacterium]|nr:carboxypeptidase regulatory-like domain-containing protein [Thermoanaerobaculia bacterium]